MKKNFSKWLILGVIVMVLLVWVLINKFQPGRRNLKEDKTIYVAKTSWNILFKPNVILSDKGKVILEIEGYIQKFYVEYNVLYKTSFVPQIEPYYCPCDSNLVNIDITCINGQTGSKSTAPPTPRPKQSGDFANVIFISNNEIMNERPDKEDFYKPGDSLYNNVIKIDKAKLQKSRNENLFAVIDGGIDVDLFEPSFGKLIWKDLPGTPTYRNFLPNQNKTDFTDRGYVKHGSAVTAIAMQAMASAESYPGIMVLKALDSDDAGSIFSVSCALSYAIQKNATVVNASLGYYGQPDSVLNYYVSLAASHVPFPVELFLAAGNTIIPPHHLSDSITVVSPNINELSKNRLFFPACFSVTYNNVTTVTQLNWPDTACYYQNYSNTFVNLGVYLGKDTCCYLPVEFRKDNKEFYEGTSFATPVASGLRMVTFLNNTSRLAADAAWKEMIKTTKSHQQTKNGNYIYYTDK